MIYWKESIGPDIELFWNELKNRNIDFERKDELNFALQKGRFRRVGQGIGARKFWSTLKGMKTIKSRFSSKEINRLTEIIKQDENKRFEVLMKCLRNNSIPQTQYLKFENALLILKAVGYLTNILVKKK